MTAPQPPDPRDLPDPIVELGPPVSTVPWSPQFVLQSIEILPLYLTPDGIRWLRPEHAESLRVGWPTGAKPGEVVMGSLSTYGLAPRLIHSTSWRHLDDRVLMTYVAVVASPDDGAVPHLVVEPVVRSDLARGDDLAPPPSIGVAQVLEHALRHLAWLIGDDAAVASAIADWNDALSAYQPEPFRALGGAEA